MDQIGYVLKGYARTSETFITNEIALLEGRGLRLTIFSFLELAGQRLHAAVDAIQAPVHYLPQLTVLGEVHFIKWLALNAPKFCRSHWRVFFARPLSYLKTLFEAVGLSFKHRRGSWQQPRMAFVKEFLQAGFIANGVLASGRIRHLHAHFCHTSTTVAMFASRLCGLPFSFTAHAKDIYVAQLNPGDLLSVKLRRAKFVVTCTAANQAHLKKLGAGRTPVHLIYHGLNLRQFAPAASVATEAQATPLILSVGRLVEKKGFTYMVEACRLLKERGYIFQCQIVGGAGAYAEQVRSAIKASGLEETILLRDAVTQEELRRIYQQATLFVLPCQITENGDRDGIPNVLAEAMAMGLPVISTNISGIPELVDHRVNGMLVPQRDAAALGEAVAELLDHPAMRRQLGEAAREKVCRWFDAEEKITALHRLFLACLDDPTNHSAMAARAESGGGAGSAA
ncbi:MAG: glycosyltransferase family 4 protein [Blastocatellia bacterium]